MNLSRYLPVLILLSASAFAQTIVTPGEAESAGVYEPKKFHEAAHALGGKLIKLQFVCRSSQMTPTADGGVTGEVVDSPTTRIKVDVEVPKDALEWFKQVPTTYSGGQIYSVYARVSSDKFGHPIAKLVGLTAHPAAKGARIEW